MANLFQQITNKIRDSRAMVAIFFISIVAFFIGLWLFGEDTYSSRVGLEQLETDLKLQAVNHWFTYWVMSVAPQVGQIVFGYAYASKKNKWFLAITVMFFLLDFTADLQDRSNRLLVQSIIDGTVAQHSAALIWSSILTLGFFTVGSEMFIVVGSGIILETFDNAIDQIAELYASVRTSWIKAGVKIKSAYDKAHNLTPNAPRPHERQGGNHGR